MIDQPNKIVDALLEDDEELDTDFAKDVANATPTNLGDLESALTGAGFKFEDDLWIKSMANQLVTLNSIGHGVGQGYSMNYYKRGERFWVFSHRYIGGVASIIARVQKLASVPVKEDLEDDESFEFEFKDILGTEDRQELYKIMDNGLLDLRGRVTRSDHHYVHERTTDVNLETVWNWDHDITEADIRYQEKTEEIVTALEREIDENMVSWNHKIYEELEAAYYDSISEDVVAENIKANNYEFEEDGTREDGGGFQYDQLTPEAQEKAREWYTSADFGDNYWSESVIGEWRWLLFNKGFNDVEINWSGFSSQGDGASFTAKSIDMRKYLMGPDPLEFPEKDRQMIDETEIADDGFDTDWKELMPEKGHWAVRFRDFDTPRKHNEVGSVEITYNKKVVAAQTWFRHREETNPNAKLRRKGLRIARRFAALEREHGLFVPDAWDNAWDWARSLGVEPPKILETEGDDADIDPRDVYDVDRKSISHIGTKADYAEYEERVREFFAREGVNGLSSMVDQHGNTITDEFSRTPCDVCRRPLAGSRTHVAGFNPKTREITYYEVCPDCEYYTEYGQLDDMTMMDMKENIEDDDFELKDIEPENPAHGLAVPGGEIITQPANQYFNEFGQTVWEVYFYAPDVEMPPNDTKTWFLGILVKTERGWHKLVATPRTISEAYPTAEEVVQRLYRESAPRWADSVKVPPGHRIGEDQDDEDFDTKELLGEPPPDTIFNVQSSHGVLTALVDDGTVVSVDLYEPVDADGRMLKQIAKFDVGEWRKFYDYLEQIEPNTSIDILDLGYWLKDGSYEPPLDDWRTEFAKDRHEREMRRKIEDI